MCKHKYKPGDTVIVRSDLVPGILYNNVMFVGSMCEYSGKELKILKCNNNGYRVYENIFTWTNDMFESFTFVMPDKDNLIDFLNI